jgi:hypothetical protein
MVRGKRLLVVTTVAAAMLLGAGVAYATIPDETGVLQGFPGRNAGQLFAAVNADGTIGSSRGVVLGPGTGRTGTGIYSVQFNRDIHGCVALAGLAIPFGSPPGAVPVGYATTSFSSFTQVNVVTFNASGRAADAPFALTLTC